jgi:poly(A) polymerase
MDGPRVNQFIQEQIKPQHIIIFQRSLQCIKHWADKRQIYSKPIGYLNGSSWTLLLLKTYLIVKDTEKLTITHLLKTFFDTWMDWPWPTPVLLTEHIPGMNGSRVDYKSLEAFQDAIMPVVSPCYPVSLATRYVTKSTLKIMTREFERGITSPFFFQNYCHCAKRALYSFIYPACRRRGS